MRRESGVDRSAEQQQEEVVCFDFRRIDGVRAARRGSREAVAAAAVSEVGSAAALPIPGTEISIPPAIHYYAIVFVHLKLCSIPLVSI